MVALSRTPRFVTFLREAVAIKTKRVLEVQKYPHVIWFSELPSDIQELRSPLTSEKWPEADPAWLKVARVQEPARPDAPRECGPWLQHVDLDTTVTTPALNRSYEDRDRSGERVEVPVTPDVIGLWERYVADEWTPWASKASVARRVRPVYQKLFSIREQVKDAADAFDLFVGVGLYESRVQPDQRFRRHLLAFPAELAVDSRTGVITLGPSADFTSARTETDFVPTTERTQLQAQIDAMIPELEALGASLQDRAAIGDLLTRMTTPISAHVRYEASLAPLDAPANGAVVSFGAALILRPRSTRSLEALLEKVRKDTSGLEPCISPQDLPTPWRKMLEDGEVWTGRSRESEPIPGASDGHGQVEVYFPLPSNDEQMRIVQKAEGAPGVVVQGPPGTGKSHTIANLISHYLAQGRRVLVTAQTAQALQVLRKKMSNDLQQLCVSLLGDSRASDRELQRSVAGILHRRQDFSPTDYKRRIADLEADLASSRNRVNQLEQTLHEARSAETERLNPEIGYRGTRAAIARQLRAEREKFGWLRDQIPYQASCPAYNEGPQALATYHQALDAAMRERLALEVLEPPFSNREARESIRALLDARHDLTNHPAPEHVTPPTTSLTSAELEALKQWLNALESVESGAAPEDSEWVTALRRVLLRNASVWDTLKSECRATLRPLSERVVAGTVKVEVTERAAPEARAALARLDRHYSEGGVRRTFFRGRPAEVRENDWVEQAVTIEGAPIQSPEEISRAKLALDGWAFLDAAWAPWAPWPVSRIGTPRTQVAVLEARLLLLSRLLEKGVEAASLAPVGRAWLLPLFDAGAKTPDIVATVARRICEVRLAAAVAQRDQLVTALQQIIGTKAVVPALRDMAHALLREDVEALTHAELTLQSDVNARTMHKRYSEFVDAIRRTAPLLAADIVGAEGTPVFAERFPVLVDAWRHRGVQNWLGTILSRERIEATHHAAREERQRQQDIVAQLSSARAWAAALDRISDRQRANLTTWAQAVAAIPATGKTVFAKRAYAQRLLGGCLSAIPAWVVSLSRLYETVDPVPGLFDVAIVDEASQCWLDSLVLFYLAKQVIIVGDDKQIAPTVVGVSDSEIEVLAKTHLPDFQFRSSFTLTSSLFDHSRRYLADAVPLREHFRCVPEIIAFSNLLCYPDRPLIPLRRVGSERLEPLKRTYLPDGIRSGNINNVEAQAIVEAIATCHDDPAYEDAKFGVICLQGDEQGERIEQLLVERLGTEAYAKRNLRCGNPYLFQGDERDVIFISMVVARNQPHQSLTTAMYEQRFNVAMSRARDQAWLFHSVQEDELGPNCLRRRVLEYFKNPPKDTINGTVLDVPHLQLVAMRAVRTEVRPPVPFDSWFEVDVALALSARGYRLSAQVQVATKWIDLVIEGDEGIRLAVECDGEAWHGADRYAEDMNRQRQLERAGWRFARVRESLFYSDEAAAIAEVQAVCEEMEIEPSGGRSTRPFASPSASSAPAHAAGVQPKNQVQSRDPSAVVMSLLDEVEDDGREDGRGEGVAGLDDTDEEAMGEGSRRARDRVAQASFDSARDYPDPKTAPATNVQAAVLDVVQQYGPLTKALVYEKYRDGCPRVARAGKSLRHAVNAALAKLERAGTIEWRDEGRRKLVDEVVFRVPGQQWVQARPTLERDIDNVPLSELAAEVIRAGGHQISSDAERLTVVLKTIARKYGVVRFRDQARSRLEAAAELACDDERAARLGLR